MFRAGENKAPLGAATVAWEFRLTCWCFSGDCTATFPTPLVRFEEAMGVWGAAESNIERLEVYFRDAVQEGRNMRQDRRDEFLIIVSDNSAL